MTLAPGPDPTQPPEAEQFLNLSLDSTDPQFAPTIVNDPVTGSNLIRLTIPQLFIALSVNNGQVAPFPVTLAGGRDGLSSAVTANDFIGGDGDFRGLRVLEVVDEVGILVAPDAVNAGQTALTKSPPPPPFPACRRRRRRRRTPSPTTRRPRRSRCPRSTTSAAPAQSSRR